MIYAKISIDLAVWCSTT